MNRAITFCFALYDPERTFDWHNYAAHLWDGPVIHCEVFDKSEEFAYYITAASQTVVRRKKFYGAGGWRFITVVLDAEQYERMIGYFSGIMAMRLRFSDTNIFCFPMNGCCCCTANRETITCSELIAGMIQHVWKLKLPHDPYMYTPNAVYELVCDLLRQGKTKKSNIQGNPNEPAPNMFSLVQDK